MIGSRWSPCCRRPPRAACPCSSFQDGHLAGAIGLRQQGALETGAVASLLAALVSISRRAGSDRSAATRGERSLGLGPLRVGRDRRRVHGARGDPRDASAALAATGVLAGTDLYPAREFGLAVAAGLMIDLILLRVPAARGARPAGAAPKLGSDPMEDRPAQQASRRDGLGGPDRPRVSGDQPG